MDKTFLNQCINDVFVEKQEIKNCISTLDIIEGLVEHFNLSYTDLEKYFSLIEDELKKCMEKAGWMKVSIENYRQIIHSILNKRTLYFKYGQEPWKTRHELYAEQKKIRIRKIRRAVDLIIEFYQSDYDENLSEARYIQMENLYIKFLTEGLLDCFRMSEISIALKEVHLYLKREGFIVQWD